MDGGAWWAAVHGVMKSRTRLSNFTFTFHFHALEKEMAAHSSVLAWRIPGTGEPGGLLSVGSHRVGHDWSDLAAAAAAAVLTHLLLVILIFITCSRYCLPGFSTQIGFFSLVIYKYFVEWYCDTTLITCPFQISTPVFISFEKIWPEFTNDGTKLLFYIFLIFSLLFSLHVKHLFLHYSFIYIIIDYC